MNDRIEHITMEQIQNGKQTFSALLEALHVVFMQEQQCCQTGGIGVDAARQAMEEKVGNNHFLLPEIPLA